MTFVKPATTFVALLSYTTSTDSIETAVSFIGLLGGSD